MQPQEISGNSGYLALARETVKGEAVTPSTFVPLYDESMSTDNQLDTNSVVYGNKAARLLVTPGTRQHSGDFTVLAEPNTTHYFFDMLLTAGAVTGSDPYTHPFTAEFTNPASYTVDLSAGNQVFRYAGVQASEVAPDYQKSELHWKVTVAALKSFLGAEIESVDGETVTLKTPVNYPEPTELLQAGDLVAIVKASDGSRTSLTVVSKTATTLTLSAEATGASAGDMLILRPATPSYPTNLTPFTWPQTQFCFGTDAASALAAAHTPLEEGSTWTMQHPFDNDGGEARSGSFDPASLSRGKSADATFKLKKFFYGTDEIRAYRSIAKQALVIRLFAGAGHECRFTFNKLTISTGGDKPPIAADETLYQELEYVPSYDVQDGQFMKVEVINSEEV